MEKAGKEKAGKEKAGNGKNCKWKKLVNKKSVDNVPKKCYYTHDGKTRPADERRKK